MVTRRGLLIGGIASAAAAVGAGAGGVLLVDHGVLPGQAALNRALGRCDAPAPAAGLRADPGPVVYGSFRSARRGREVGFAIGYPPGYADGARLPVCLALHGYGADARGGIGTGDYPSYLAGLVRAGGAPFALAAVDGGNGYWHPHPQDDPLGMVFDEFLPLLGSRGLRMARPAVAGWSMGGYGALLCALTQPARFSAVVASSPAVFHSFGDARSVNPGAFGSASEWARYDVTARAREFGGLPVRIDIGAADPFAPAVGTLRDRLPDRSVVHVATGCHDNTFWTYAAPAQLHTVSTALASNRT